MTHLSLVRHGETDWNAAGRIQGLTDIPLNDVGREQARRTGERLARRSWNAIFSSPLSRAFETASIIGAEIGLQPHPDGALVERRYGDAEGMDHRSLRRRYPIGTAVPGRENRQQVASRVLPALVRLAEHRPHDRLVVVTHGGVIRSVLTAVEPDAVANGVPIGNGSVHTFRFVDGLFRLIAFDDPVDAAATDSDDFDDQNAVEEREDSASPA